MNRPSTALALATAVTLSLWALMPVISLAPACIMMAKAQAATQPSLSPAANPIRRPLEGLAAEDAPTRERAREQLMAISRGDLPLLRQAVADLSPLLPAQAILLREVVTQAYLASDAYEGDPHTGFLGISMVPVEMPQEHSTDPDLALGVMVSERIIGFDAYRALQDGDVILSVDEFQIRRPEDVRLAVGARKPGGVCRVRVLRHGRAINTTLRISPRPVIADQGRLQLEEFIRQRQLRADDYFDREFLPLLPRERI